MLEEEKQIAESESEKTYPIIIKLSKPITDEDGNELKQLTIKKEPTGGDLIGFTMTNPKAEDYFRFAQNVCGVSVPILKKISIPDLVKLITELSDFFEQA